MFVFQLLKLIEKSLPHVEEDNLSIKTIHALSDVYGPINDLLNPIVGDLREPGRTQQRCQELVDRLMTMVNEVKAQTKSWQLFKSLDEAIQQLQLLCGVLKPNDYSVAQHLDEFKNAYDVFITDQLRPHALTLVIQAHRTYGAAITLRETLSKIHFALSSSSPEANSEGVTELTLQFDATASLEVVAAKISLIATAYQQFCDLLEINLSARPITLKRVECGSLLITIIGVTAVLVALRHCLIQVARLRYTSYVRDAKLKSRSEFTRAIRAQLDLVKCLESAGVPTDGIKKKIAELGETHLDTLIGICDEDALVALDDEAVVTVSSTSGFTKHLLGPAEPKALTDRSQDNEVSG